MECPRYQEEVYVKTVECRKVKPTSAWSDIIKYLILAAVLVLVLPGPARAGFDEGVAAYNHGFSYFQGRGVQQDYAEAAKWFREAADQGHVEAEFSLGVIYNLGLGALQDDAEAFKWFRRAAEQGYAPAQFNVAIMYSKGRGVPKDFAEGAKWLRRAAEQGHAPAQHNLGFVYEKGHGVPKDSVQAYMWSSLAASKLPPGEGGEDAAKRRDEVAAKLTPKQLTRAQELARKWKPSSR